MTKRQRENHIRNSHKIPKRKMPPPGTLITVKYRDEDDPSLVRVREIVERYGLKAIFVKVKEQ